MIAVTGASGAVGRRVVRLLAARPSSSGVLAVDRVPMRPPPGVEFRLADVTTSGAEVFAGCSSVVHLAEDALRRQSPAASVAALDAVVDRMDRVGCRHLVVLSSAMVYGAHPGNPVPLTEGNERRPNEGLGYALAKASLEERAEAWAERADGRLAVLRPTTTLSERGAGYVAAAMRTAIALRADDVEAPVQFLHHHDLAAAAALAAERQLDGVYNVAPDHWLAPDEFSDLLAEVELPRPPAVTAVTGRLGPLLRPRTTHALAPYVAHPWVVANDRLRAEGWTSTYTNEEALVAGMPTPRWRSIWDRRRQELALAATGVGAVVVVAGGILAVRRLWRR
ncbi:MAG: NAD-dependent epimerase/dehydratase family protein [Actinomycetota bacterium]